MTVPKVPAWEQAGRSIYSTARVHSINPSRLLHYLGIFGNCTGYYYFIAALSLMEHSPGRKVMMTKEVYPVIARQYGSTQAGVERAMRTAMHRVWAQFPEKIEEIAGGPLAKRPTLGAFLYILADFCRENK